MTVKPIANYSKRLDGAGSSRAHFIFSRQTRPGKAHTRFHTARNEVPCPGASEVASDFLGDIAVIRMKPDHGKRIAHQLQALGIPHLLMATQPSKRAYDPRKPRINILTVQSSKGLEFRSVIFLFPENRTLKTSKLSQT